jgi:hypothetical protein
MAPLLKKAHALESWQIAGTSLLILLVFSLQAVASFACPSRGSRILAPLRVFCAPTLWPFVDYPMYSRAHYEGDKYTHRRVIGIYSDSSESTLHWTDFDVPFYLFTRIFLRAVDAGDLETIQVFVDRFHRTGRKSMIGLRLEAHPFVFASNELHPRSTRIVKEIRFDGGSE